ncbi:MAG: hypothetical protein H6550_15855 [Chitinophagales bacterium]|nr:hypothetical protein [Chitinophagales bacterium]
MILLRPRKILTAKLSFNAVLPHPETVSMQRSGVPMGMPSRVTTEEFDRIRAEYGLFGGSAGTNKFYADLKLEDIMPKAEDYVNIPMRFISQAIVGGGSWKATDFSTPGVLEASVQRLGGKPMFTEHDQEVLNAVGLIANPYWESATGTGEQFVPGGISGNAMVDYKSNPRLARLVLSGAIYSSSVTATFNFEASHTFKDAEEFFRNVGTISNSDNKMVRRVVTEVLDYDESSFVWLGADPYAKTKAPDGTLRNVDHKSVYFSKADTVSYDKADSKEMKEYTDEKRLHINFAIPQTVLSLSKEKVTTQFSTQTPKEVKMNKFAIAFIATFGKSLGIDFEVTEETQLTDDQVSKLTEGLTKLGIKDPAAPDAVSFVNRLFVANDKLEAIAAAPATLLANKGEFVAVPKSEYTALVDKSKLAMDADTKQALEERATMGDKHIAFQRSECERLYKLSLGKAEPNQAVLKNIQDAKADLLEGMLQQYGKEAVQKTAAFCTHCNSGEHIDMRSTVDTSEGKGDHKTPDNASFSVAAMRDKFNRTTLVPTTK